MRECASVRACVRTCVRSGVRACVRDVFAIYDTTILALSITDGAGYLMLFALSYCLLWLTFCCVGAYVRLAHPACRWRVRECVAHSRIHL